MALPLAVAAGGLASVAYLNAKYLISNDLEAGRLNSEQALKYITDRFLKDRILTYHVLEDQATGANADTIFLIFEDRTWTYAEFFADLQRVGNWLMNDLGVAREEIVALDGANSPEYLLLWFALDGLGSAMAFINSNLTAQPLVHSAKLCGSRYLITDQDNKHNVGPHEAELSASNVKVVYYSPAFIATLTDTTLLPQSRRAGLRPDSIRNLIYTSGTTGLPKATIMTTGRELNTGKSVAEYLKLKPGDRMYTAMPLYHGAAHGLLVTPCIHAGATIVLSRKFSHKTFWPEVRSSKANIIQYVGELCRYLLNAPPSPLDKEHNVHMAWGNGMRPDVWEPFRQRFGIPVINELYAATDGLGATFNYNKGDFGRNCVGLRGLLWHLQNRGDEVRVRIDVVTEEILRDKNGFAIKCKAGEPGEVFHRLLPEMEARAFAGYYQNPTASEKRKIENVFKKGDKWFRSGDMMVQDKDGRVYFVDRLGDTFRWRSENVSTNEVSDVLGTHPQIAEANVYGVQIPHADGRAGCAAIVFAHPTTAATADFAGIARHLIDTLPRYAVPIFLRVVSELQYTGTMKLQKGKMRAEGVDLEKIRAGGGEDKMFWLPPGRDCYEVFGEAEWGDVKGGRVKL